MRLHDGLMLYHGSYVEVPLPDLSKCARFKDFGRGFYVTTSYEQARSFAKLSTRKAAERNVMGVDIHKGFVSSYKVEGVGTAHLQILDFAGADSHWLQCIVAHRRRRSYPALVKELSIFDVVVGKIADDQTNITLALYMDGVFGLVGSEEAESACVARLLPNRLKDQYCFRSVRALDCLQYVESEVVWM